MNGCLNHRNQACRSCEFWNNANGSAGYCHRYAPSQPKTDGNSKWPLTYSADWCGDYKKTETDDPA